MSLSHAILGVLEHQPLHGYALKCVLEEGISYFWPVNLAAIYPSLRRLEADGLLTHEREATSSGRPDRKVYSVTDAGREELARWRRVPPDLELPRSKNPLFLKLLFARRENLPDVRDWVHKAIDEGQRQAGALRSVIEGADPSTPYFVEFLRDSGMAHLELNIDRLTELLVQVKRMIADERPPSALREFGLGHD